MKLTLRHQNLTVEIYDDSAYTGTPDSPTTYQRKINTDNEANSNSNSRHAIRVYENEREVNNAILLSFAIGTRVHEHTALIDEGNLIIQCGNMLVSLSLPDLNVNWKTRADWSTCFSVNKYNDGYITHGEMSIRRFDRSGKEVWEFTVADIFVCVNNDNPFEMFEDYIALRDFEGKKYKIDYNGKLL